MKLVLPRWVCVVLILWLTGCSSRLFPTNTPTPRPTERADIRLISFDAISKPVVFSSPDGTHLAGQFDFPPILTEPPIVFIIHHSGAVDRDAYQYLAAHLVPAGYAVFRFDKRGTGKSAGVYGCCEENDAVAAYRAAVSSGINAKRVFIIAQSIGTKILANRWSEFEQVRPPDGVVLLSNLLEYQEIIPINAPLHVIISGSESRLDAIGDGAVKAHRAAKPSYGASFQVIPNTEHTLFDISTGPIDWADPNWSLRFHPEAWQSLRGWLDRRR